MGLFTHNFDSATLSNHLHLIKVTIFSKPCLCVFSYGSGRTMTSVFKYLFLRCVQQRKHLERFEALSF